MSLTLLWLGQDPNHLMMLMALSQFQVLGQLLLGVLIPDPVNRLRKMNPIPNGTGLATNQEKTWVACDLLVPLTGLDLEDLVPCHVKV